ncbi:MAG: hypothetical protein IJG51_08190 [Synergistaceae bacterium]|nr:hypothetical protein [Synergistaceae bacterium]MBQ3346519.1 hypothetical protein [Synergistaceae bacterium]MBQ3398854.1 hypothetical protein [Synergistaceae bacterium]MBQ3760315.1 hypothetical protein [Synergistaceae bacterium]MBQ6002428.1 hypothetical protein [Synergistaceae bacterium]
MGLIDDIGNFMKTKESEILRTKYGVRTPSDAIGAADKIMYGRDSDSAKASKIRPLIAWLVGLSRSGNDEAEDALRSIDGTHHRFLVDNDIDTEI